jgi:hypothetical protein
MHLNPLTDSFMAVLLTSGSAACFHCFNTLLIIWSLFPHFVIIFITYLELLKPPLKFMLKCKLLSAFINRSRNLSIYLIFLPIMIYTENYGEVMRNKMQRIIWTGQITGFQWPRAEGISSRPILGPRSGCHEQVRHLYPQTKRPEGEADQVTWN